MTDNNIVNANGAVITTALYWFARGVGSANGKKPKIVGLANPRYTPEDIALLERRNEWFGF